MHSVERLERSGKEEREAHAGASCCSCADRGSTVVIGGPFLLVEENVGSTCDRSARPVKMKSAELVTDKGQTVRGMPVLMLTRAIPDRHSLGTLLRVEQQSSPPLAASVPPLVVLRIPADRQLLPSLPTSNPAVSVCTQPKSTHPPIQS